MSNAVRSSYNDNITLLIRLTHFHKSGHIGFWRFVGSKCKEREYTNSQSQPTTYFRNALEFARIGSIWTRVVFPHVQSLPVHQKHKSLS